MSTNGPTLVLDERNVSHAWARAFLAGYRGSSARLAPMVLSIGPFDDMPDEDAEIRHLLDGALDQHEKFSSRVSAEMIFPYSYWLSLGKPECSGLTARYLGEMLPRLRARGGVHTRYGTYFERMVDFRGSRESEPDGVHQAVAQNQLDFIIRLWKENRERGTRPRQSALVVSCFDPAKDHTRQPLRGFPCLQQVSFGYDEQGMSVSAYYPTQYLFDRAYGNYLGLSQLGSFMARELNLRFCRLNVFVGRPELGSVSKGVLKSLADALLGTNKFKGEPNGVLER